jgi:hypothetical protein
VYLVQGVADTVLAGLKGSAATSRALSTQEAASLRAAMEQDANDAIYSGALTIAEAVHGLERRLYTWATVKLYYSVFYLARAALGLNGTCIFYIDRTPYTWESSAGATPRKRAGNTHKAVLDVFASQLSRHVLLSQPIGQQAAHEWLMSRRESANYKMARFSEPDAPNHFKFVERRGVRQPLRDYLADSVHLYTFDPDHAMLSFPVAALKDCLALLKAGGGALPAADAKLLANYCRDRAGPVPEFRKLLSS